MGNERRSSVIAKLRSALVSTREKIVADGLFVGTSCTIALVSYTHYTPHSPTPRPKRCRSPT